MDLFSYQPSYPDAPGYRHTDTSRAAAQGMKPRAGTLQDEVLKALSQHGPLATFEMPAKVGATYRALQPRTSELAKKGLIVDSGCRRTDPETGRSAIVWRAA